ncbi:MAG: aspartate--tRNA ligase [Clostridia bacterium]|jgi:aspartyl-tRNA synthetase|nr:aspartate--tRNA ligase [Clostridia bacterium]
MGKFNRTHMCGELNEGNIGQQITVYGWVQKSRDLGSLKFIDLRDRTGIVQAVINKDATEDLFNEAAKVRGEFVLEISGEVAKRGGAVNTKISTGSIEIIVSNMQIISKAETPPIYIEDDAKESEALRLKYRYLDLRKPSMQKIFFTRHKAAKVVRDYLDEKGFIEVETPILTKTTPEGARDYLVPSRVQPGNFFALPQSPQLFKQILMVSGFDKYFQIVKCFRDEDLRADRQPEFTQIDMELSFVDADDVMKVNEGLLQKLFKEILGIELQLPFNRLTYKEAMERYGSDKPDTRFGLELKNIGDIVANAEFKVFADTIANKGLIKAINAEGIGAKISRKEIDSLGEYVKVYKAKGLAWINVTEEGIKSPIAKFLKEEEMNAIVERMQAKVGDIIFIVADAPNVTDDALGQLRLEVGRRFNLIDASKYNFLWVTEFPLLEYDAEEDRYVAKHHPFTSPMDEDIPLLDTNPAEARAKAYDVVLNGYEIGGGSIRIHNQQLQEKMFGLLGFSSEEAWAKFGFLLEAFKYGTPPHGGLAFGLDRIIMLLTGTDNIKDVVAFPKTQTASCLMTNAPSPADAKQLEELKIATKN